MVLKIEWGKYVSFLPSLLSSFYFALESFQGPNAAVLIW